MSSCKRSEKYVANFRYSYSFNKWVCVYNSSSYIVFFYQKKIGTKTKYFSLLLHELITYICQSVSSIKITAKIKNYPTKNRKFFLKFYLFYILILQQFHVFATMKIYPAILFFRLSLRCMVLWTSCVLVSFILQHNILCFYIPVHICTRISF